MQSIGLLTTTNVMPGKAVDVQAVYKRTLRLVHDLGEQTLYNKPEYIYGDTPLWLDISKDVIRTYLNDVMEHYPEATRQRMRALIREINQSDACSWNVIIGEPAKNRGQSFDMGVGRRIFCGSPQPPKVIGDALEFAGSARTDMAFFAMIRTEDINRTDAILLDRKIAEVVSTIKRKAKENGGTIPMVIQNALAPYQPEIRRVCNYAGGLTRTPCSRRVSFRAVSLRKRRLSAAGSCSSRSAAAPCGSRT
jgi:hypothetical protein